MTKAKFLAVLLNQDTFFTDYALQKDYEEAFGSVDENEFNKAFSALRGNDTVIAFDVEQDGLDGVFLDHQEHGTLDPQEYSIVSALTYFSLGPAFPIALQQDLHSVSEAAADGGLSESLRLLSLLPIDSSRWTGMATEFRLTPEVQGKVVTILGAARGQIHSLGLTNAEAAKATAYIDCALILANLPEPEHDAIQLLLRRLLVAVGAVGFFADLQSLLFPGR